jgi:prepilin signal peptidase PulO-like enzyme (type II secretory pathway)
MLSSLLFLRWISKKKGEWGIDNSKKSFIPEIILLGTIVFSWYFWTQGFNSSSDIILFGLWIIIIEILFSLANVNIRYMVLPDKLIAFLAIAIFNFQFINSMQQAGVNLILNVLLGGVILGGIPFLLWFFTNGKGMGFGDVKLGLVAGFLLGWKNSILCIFLMILIFTLIKIFYQVTKKPIGVFPTGIVWATSIVLSTLFGQNIIGMIVGG